MIAPIDSENFKYRNRNSRNHNSENRKPEIAKPSLASPRIEIPEPREFSKPESRIFETKPPLSFKSLDDVFVPIENGRQIIARKIAGNIGLEIRDGDYPEQFERDSFLETIKREYGTEISEYTGRGASLLVARLASPQLSERCWSIRWTEHVKPNGTGAGSWYFQTVDFDMFQQVAMHTGFKWRARQAEPATYLEEPVRWVSSITIWDDGHECDCGGNED